jgi:hypothetical protein
LNSPWLGQTEPEAMEQQIERVQNKVQWGSEETGQEH